MKNKDQIVLENIYQKIKEQYDAPQAVPPAQVSKEKSSMGSMMGDIFRAAYTDTLRQRGYTEEQIKKYWEEFDKQDKNKKTSNGEIDFQNPEVQNKVKQAYKQKGYTDEDLKILDSLFKPEKINSLKSSMLANGIDINKILKESVGGIEAEAGFGNEYGNYKFKVNDLIKFSEKYQTKEVPLSFIQKTEAFKNIPQDTQKGSKERIQKANYSFPVILQIDDNKNITGIGDGTHRIRAAIRDGREKIPAKLIPVKDWEIFKNEI